MLLFYRDGQDKILLRNSSVSRPKKTSNCSKDDFSCDDISFFLGLEVRSYINSVCVAFLIRQKLNVWSIVLVLLVIVDLFMLAMWPMVRVMPWSTRGRSTCINMFIFIMSKVVVGMCSIFFRVCFRKVSIRLSLVFMFIFTVSRVIKPGTY